MSRYIVGIGCGILVIAIGGFAIHSLLWPGASATAARDGFSPARFLAAIDDIDFAGLESAHAFRFPADHGRHDGYRTEWWQLAGVLEAADADLLGLQLIVLRIAAEPRADASARGWGSGELYAGLISLAGVDTAAPRSGQRLVRGGIGLAGWQAEPMLLWLEDWQIAQVGVASREIDLKLEAALDDMLIRLDLRNRQPLIDSGAIFDPGDEPGLPFAYYLQPRLDATGSLIDGGGETALAGTVSIEHAWGELPLPGGPVAQDRLTLFLRDGRTLLLLRSHRVDGSGTASTTGLIADTGGLRATLAADEIELRATAYGDGAATGASYPLRWDLRVPAHGIDVELVATPADAEGSSWEAFWAGPVRLHGSSRGLVGVGFVQLSGYRKP